MTLKNLWQILKSKETPNTPLKDKRHNHEFTDEDREHALEMRRLRQQTARMREKMALIEQRRELEELKAELEEEANEPEEEDDPMMKIFAPMLANQLNSFSKPAPHSNNEAPPLLNQQEQVLEKPQYSDEDIRNYLKTIPKLKLALAKRMDKQKVYEMINEQIPLSIPEFERGYQILISEF